MCVILHEDSLLGLFVSEPTKLLAILESTDVAIEIERFETGCCVRSFHCIVDMTKEEVLRYAALLKQQKILDIEDSIWYKYFEENNTPSIEIFQLTIKEPIMSNKTAEELKMEAEAAAEAAKAKYYQAGKTHWSNHGGKYKAFGLFLLGMVVGAGVKAVVDKRTEGTSEEAHSA